MQDSLSHLLPPAPSPLFVMSGSIISGESYSDAPGLYEMFLRSCFSQSAVRELSLVCSNSNFAHILKMC